MTKWDELLVQAERKRRGHGFGSDAAFRLFDGASDGAHGVYIDVFAGRWLVQTLAASLPGGLSEAIATRDVAWWWKRLDQNEKDSPVPMTTMATDDPFLIVEHTLHFEISFRSGYSQGLFIDQRDNRRRVRDETKPGQRVLNLFAYTGGFSVAAASAGAITTTVDLSATYLEWAKRNFRHNRIDPEAHFFIKGDAMDWLGAFAKKQRFFDGIVLDPPTFSRIKGHGTWRAETDYHLLVEAAARVLNPGGWIFASTNCRKLDAESFQSHLRLGFSAAARTCAMTQGGMPPDFTGEPYLLNTWCRS